MQGNLSATENVVNAEITEDLLCFIYDDKRGDKIPLAVTDSSREKIFLTVFFNCDPLLKPLWQYYWNQFKNFQVDVH